MSAAYPAVLSQLHPIGMGFLVLGQVVISAFALRARHNDPDSRASTSHTRNLFNFKNKDSIQHLATAHKIARGNKRREFYIQAYSLGQDIHRTILFCSIQWTIETWLAFSPCACSQVRVLFTR